MHLWCEYWTWIVDFVLRFTVQDSEEPLLNEVPIAGCLGDQQAALVGQRCFNAGDAKNT